MQKHTKRQVKDNFKKDAFISDGHRCLCVISDQTEMAKEKEYFDLIIFLLNGKRFIFSLRDTCVM